MLNKIALILAIIGGLNWGCIGLFQFDLVAWIFGGSGSLLARIVYTLVGLAAVWCIPCSSGTMPPRQSPNPSSSCGNDFSKSFPRSSIDIIGFICYSIDTLPSGVRRCTKYEMQI